MPVGLAPRKILGFAEELQIFVVSEDLEGVVGTKEVVLPLIEDMHDGKHFEIGHMVVAFRLIKRA